MPTVLVANTGRPTGQLRLPPPARRGQIPGVLYGRGMTPVSVAVGRRDLRVALSGAAGVNTVLDLTVDGTVYPAIVKDLQRHPVRRTSPTSTSCRSTSTRRSPFRCRCASRARPLRSLQGGGLVDPPSTHRGRHDAPEHPRPSSSSTSPRWRWTTSSASRTFRCRPASRPPATRRARRHGADDACRDRRDRGPRCRGRRGAGPPRARREAAASARPRPASATSRVGRLTTPPGEAALHPVRLVGRRAGEPRQGVRPHPPQRRRGGRRRAGPPARRPLKAGGTTRWWPSPASATNAGCSHSP